MGIEKSKAILVVTLALIGTLAISSLWSFMRVDSLQTEVTSLTSEKNSLQSQVNSLMKNNTDLQSQMGDLQNQIDSLATENDDLLSQIDNLQSQIDSLMQAQRELFPENLILRGLNPGRTDHIRDLIDETTRYHGLKSVERWQKSIDTTSVYIYNITFIYQKIPTNAYQILGFPVVSLEFNVTNTPSAEFWIDFDAYLGKVSMTGEWTTLAYIHGWNFAFSGENTDAQCAVSLFPYSPLNITIGAYERLAIRVTAEGHTSQGTTILTLDNLPSEILADIPIVKNP